MQRARLVVIGVGLAMAVACTPKGEPALCDREALEDLALDLPSPAVLHGDDRVWQSVRRAGAPGLSIGTRWYWEGVHSEWNFEGYRRSTELLALDELGD